MNNSKKQTYVLEQYDMTDLNTETEELYGRIFFNPKYMCMCLSVENLMVDDAGHLIIYVCYTH